MLKVFNVLPMIWPLCCRICGEASAVDISERVKAQLLKARWRVSVVTQIGFLRLHGISQRCRVLKVVLPLLVRGIPTCLSFIYKKARRLLLLSLETNPAMSQSFSSMCLVRLLSVYKNINFLVFSPQPIMQRLKNYARVVGRLRTLSVGGSEGRSRSPSPNPRSAAAMARERAKAQREAPRVAAAGSTAV